ncbi:CoA transferase [Bradyrhizobium ottawaense]|uniref:CoA transferase n=1 Tax=Bradyrhizobium ottawaense TaxID=931866 RepID=UPI0003F60D48|nr:CoA transferase [Bradyrhizobium ottawaense]
MEKEVAKQAGNNHPTSIPTGVFRTSDGYINIATTGGWIWERCAQAIGAPELYAHPDYATDPARSMNRDALTAEIEKRHRDEVDRDLGPRAQRGRRALWPDLCHRPDVRGRPVKHLGIAQDVPNDEDRHIRLVGQPVTLSRMPSRMVARLREFGEQTDEVLREFGFDADEVAKLRDQKMV